MLLYPRLPITAASDIADSLLSESIENLRHLSAVTHPDAVYTPTGGNRVNETYLSDVYNRFRDCARSCGYPEPLDSHKIRSFDAASGKMLHQILDISPSEASYQGAWAFMACVLWPDIVRWRFPGVTDITSKDRFLGGSRGLRNTFGRVWWRAYLLKQPENDHPYELLDLLGEDELVQVTERPNIAGSPILARQICKTFLETVTSSSTTGITRSKLLRDAMKRIRRLLPLISFDALDENILQELVSDIFKASLTSLSVTHTAI